MSAAGSPYQSQAKLWLVAFSVSALVNVLALGVIGFWVIANIALRPAPRSGRATETVATIMPQFAEETPEALKVPSAASALAAESSPAPPADRPFARTSPDQNSTPPEKADFIGERSTVATSDAAPQGERADMPQQKGREPFSADEIETTESSYQDGDLDSQGTSGSAANEMAAAPEADSMAEALTVPAPADEVQAVLPEPVVAEERLAEGPVTVDRRVKIAPPGELPKPPPAERRINPEEATEQNKSPAEQPKPAAAAKPGFRGKQTKTRLEGSIDRMGRSALNVEDSVLGRYHAAVSRAVEKTWQLHCVRNRDYITPGQLTLRVMLEPTGKVRAMAVVEEIGIGNIQKGFTLTSIRDAEIPIMPAPLKKQLDGEPLELIYRFNF